MSVDTSVEFWEFWGVCVYIHNSIQPSIIVRIDPYYLNTYDFVPVKIG